MKLFFFNSLKKKSNSKTEDELINMAIKLKKEEKNIGFNSRKILKKFIL